MNFLPIFYHSCQILPILCQIQSMFAKFCQFLVIFFYFLSIFSKFSIVLSIFNSIVNFFYKTSSTLKNKNLGKFFNIYKICKKICFPKNQIILKVCTFGFFKRLVKRVFRKFLRTLEKPKKKIFGSKKILSDFFIVRTIRSIFTQTFLFNQKWDKIIEKLNNIFCQICHFFVKFQQILFCLFFFENKVLNDFFEIFFTKNIFCPSFLGIFFCKNFFNFVKRPLLFTRIFIQIFSTIFRSNF